MLVGWDWASAAPDVTVIDDAGTVVDHWTPPHTEAGLSDALMRLAHGGRPEELPVAIEQSSGLVVDRLLAAGHPVVPVHAGAFHAARPRWGAAGAKSDAGDSYKLADYLRTDGHRLRWLQPPNAATRQLQALVRLREDHVKAKVAASNQLGALLDAHWPGAKQVCSRSPLRSPWPSWTPTRPRRQPPGWVRRGWWPSAGATPPVVAAARLSCWPGLVQPQPHHWACCRRRLPNWSAPRSGCCAPCLAPSLTWTTPSVPAYSAGLLASMPRIGEVNLAQLIAEVGPVLDPVDTAEQAIAEGGAAPVTRASGKTRTVGFRWAANRQAPTALHAFADNSRHPSPWAARLYADARRRGKHHPHAIRILARAWLRVIWACWPTNTAYDPAKNDGEQRLTART